MSNAKRTVHDDAKTYLRNVREASRDKKEMYAEFRGVMEDFNSKRAGTSDVIMRIKELFKGHPELILGFNSFLPEDYEITLPLKEETLTKTEGASGFAEKIKERFQGDDDHVYQAFRGILKMYSEGNKSKAEVYQEVSILLQDHADLLVEFNHFLSDDSGTVEEKHTDDEVEKGEHRVSNLPTRKRKHVHGDDSLSNLPIKKRKVVHGGIDESMSAFCQKVKERLQDSGNYEKFLDCVHSYQGKLIATAQFRERVANLLGMYQDLMEETEDFISNIEKTGLLQSNRQIKRSFKEDQGDDNKSNNDNGERPIREIDLSKCDSCTPSYRLLPENYPIPVPSHRTNIGSQVLNDHCVSVTFGTEDYSFKHMRKNRYEKSLFRCEDDKFELDMLLEAVSATAKRIEDLLGSMNSHINKTDNTFRIEDHLTVLNLRCIEKIYGDNGLDVTKALRKNPESCLPVILTRLNQKLEEGEKSRAQMTEILAKMFAKNYHKSLDYRSLNFKQKDMKNLSAKVLLADIEDIRKKNETVEDKSHMDFKYTDHEIHEDLYHLMNYASGEIFTPEKHVKAMKIWTSFVEALLCLPPRPKSAEENLENGNDVDAEENGDDASENDENERNGVEHKSKIFYANDSIYLLVRLHRILYERILSAKLHSTENKWGASKNAITTDSYIRFKEALHDFLDGSLDNSKFEDECRAIVGAESYVLFTLDKLIHKLLKQLHAVAADEVVSKLLQLYARERSRNSAAYHERARFLLPDANLYRIECFPLPPTRLTIELMKNTTRT